MKRMELRPLSSFRVFPPDGVVTAVAWAPGEHALFASATGKQGMILAPGRKPRAVPVSDVPDSLVEPVDGRRVMLVSRRGTVIVDLETSASIQLEGVSGNVLVSHDGAIALGLNPERKLALHSTRDGSLLQTLECPGVVDYALSGDGSTVTALGNGSLWTWRAPFRDAPRRLERRELPGTYRIALSADGTRAASVHREQFVQLWDLEAGTELVCVFRMRDWTCHQLVLDPTGTFAVVADARGVTAFDFERKEKGESLEWSRQQSNLVSRNGQLVWQGTPGGQVEAFRVSKQRSFVRAPNLDAAPTGVFHFINVTTSNAARVEVASGAVKPAGELRPPFARDGEALYGAGPDGMHVVDGGGRSLSVVSGFPVVRAAAGGGRLAAAGARGQFSVWPGPATRDAEDAPRSFAGVEALALSPDGALLAVATARDVHLLEASTLEPRRTFPKKATASALWFSGDTLCVSYDSMDEEDIASIEHLPLAGGRRTRVNTACGMFLAVTSDGGLLLMRGWWSQLLLFEPMTGTLLDEQPYDPDGQRTPVSGAFSRDGRRIAVGTAEGELVIHELSPRL